jgi:hypothetical protein
MTASITTLFPIERPSHWNVFFAADSDKDLDFDEGFEEDELHQSKPPSRRPLLWIGLLVLVGAIAYWTVNDQAPQRPRTASIESAGSTKTSGDNEVDMFPPMFSENQTVVLVEENGESMLMGDPTNSLPGPIVKTGEPLTILDGIQQLGGWVYHVQTASGKKGWIAEEKLKHSS